MPFDDQQAMVRDMARAFACAELRPHAARWDREHAVPRSVLARMGELGFMGMLVPPEWGGAGMDYQSYALAVEEIAAGCGAVSTIMSVHNSVACMPLLLYGTESQQSTFLRPLAQGQMLGAFCLTEPQAGSDASALRTRAVADGDAWVLNGSKMFVTSGRNADVAIVFAVTDPDAGKKGISAFIVPTSLPGWQVLRVEEKLGLHASDTCQIALDNIRLPGTLMLGQLGDGYRIALSNLEGGRIGIAAQAVGMARAAFELARDYACQRETFGRPLIEHQALAFRLADMKTQIAAARLMVSEAAACRDSGRSALTEASMAKLFASEMAERVCSAALQMFGGYGYMRDCEVERIYRDVRVCQIYEGTSDVQRMVIARAIAQECSA
ncbi:MULTISPECIES: acyl-CoA dehydrogenase family protein [unclassified Haematospirillum]|uniref:acyl-CoA dehydrogenase family protein n=1 Tax=unclassified Haematospirillum TaxID=2622088 RepID=UPI001438E162|nr:MULTISPECIES: acyl-CoA dehydrogenase family protein [unclassified Haematospirillum]NKD54948.1 acyl-CoA dehydrogenase [Haematospirillum sp. H4890]NKD74969.1 acyl-CoA dehydrogenase [Haematospirillum sp. H4485]NKD88496.1 acyl-CoA dehydrogenase [Haematospirillum sp. 15-248]